jgi:uncharacterized phage protein gp47/JayE
MSGPYPLPTLAPTISATGISAPIFGDILASIQAYFMQIYGSDIVLDNSTQDGQLCGILASIINDCNSAAIAVYNNYSPTTAIGVGLSSIVKTNGIERLIATNSSAPMLLIGQPDLLIYNGAIQDLNNNIWALPSPTQIGSNGQTTATAVCLTPGAIQAGQNTINTIFTPTYGWQSATNVVAATPGNPVEEDGQLRERQQVSTSIPAQTTMAALTGAIANIPGVTAYQPYENSTGYTNAQGIPPRSLCMVVEGGDAQTIGDTIRLYKTEGAPTFGNISIFTVDSAGIPAYINYQTANPIRVIAQLTLTPLLGYVDTTAPLIQQAMSNWVAGIPTGGNNGDGVSVNDLIASAKLPPPLGNTYKIAYGSMLIAEYGNTLAAADIALNFADNPSLAVSDITVIVP